MTVYVIDDQGVVEGEGDSAQEALWDLKRKRPDDLFYPVVPEGSAQPVGVHVRTGEDHMEVVVMTISDSADLDEEPVNA